MFLALLLLRRLLLLLRPAMPHMTAVWSAALMKAVLKEKEEEPLVKPLSRLALPP
jgi:hypothetical protein